MKYFSLIGVDNDNDPLYIVVTTIRCLEVRILNAIKRARMNRGLSQAEVAAAVTETNVRKVTQQAVAKWENCQSKPRADLLVAVADVLGVTVDDLLKEE